MLALQSEGARMHLQTLQILTDHTKSALPREVELENITTLRRILLQTRPQFYLTTEKTRKGKVWGTK